MIYFWFVWVQLYSLWVLFSIFSTHLSLNKQTQTNAFQSNQYFSLAQIISVDASNTNCHFSLNENLIPKSIPVYHCTHCCLLLLYYYILAYPSLYFLLHGKVENSKGGPNLKVFMMESCWILDDKERYVYIQLTNWSAAPWKHSNTSQAMLYSSEAMEVHLTRWTSSSSLEKWMRLRGYWFHLISQCWNKRQITGKILYVKSL